MSTTPNMGLTKWDLSSDPYDHTQLANNFSAIDVHDHTAGKGVQVPTGGIANLAITTAKLADGSVTAAKLGASAVSSAALDQEFIHPLGSLLLWWRPNLSTSLPSGWVIAMGQSLLAANHNFAGGGTIVLPDYRNSVPLGADVSGTGSGTATPPAIGDVGGSHTAALGHTHTVANHTHTIADDTVVVNSAGGLSTNSVADHTHQHTNPIGHSASQSSIYVVGPNSAFNNSIGTSTLNQIYTPNVASVILGVGSVAPEPFTLYSNFEQYVITSSAAGAHSHTTGSHGHTTVAHGHGSATGSAGGQTTSTTLGSTDIRNKFVGTLILMKVKYV